MKKGCDQRRVRLRNAAFRRQSDNARTLDLLETPVLSNLLRLVEDDTAALRQSRNRRQCQAWSQDIADTLNSRHR